MLPGFFSFPLVAENRGYSLVEEGRLLLAVASLVAEHRPWGSGLQELQLPGCKAQTVDAAQGLGCSMACGVLSGQGSNLCLLNWQADSSPLSHEGSPTADFNSDFLL